MNFDKLINFLATLDFEFKLICISKHGFLIKTVTMTSIKYLTTVVFTKREFLVVMVVV